MSWIAVAGVAVSTVTKKSGGGGGGIGGLLGGGGDAAAAPVAPAGPVDTRSSSGDFTFGTPRPRAGELPAWLIPVVSSVVATFLLGLVSVLLLRKRKS